MSISDGIFCLGVDHHATPLGVREVLASSSGDRWIPHLIEHGGAAEVVFLSTCNRVEIYGRSESRGPAIVSDVARSMPLDFVMVLITTTTACRLAFSFSEPSFAFPHRPLQ